MAGLTADEFQLLREAVDERRCRDEIGLGKLAEAATAYRPDPECPGRRRQRSLEGRLHRRRRPEVALPLLRQEVHLPHGHRPRALPEAAPRLGLLHQAHAPQRPRRVRGRAVRHHPQDRLRVAAPRARHGIRHQDRIVPRDTVWVDETYNDGTDLSKGYGRARKRGLSHQKLCNCVAIDVHKNTVAIARGHGKPSSARVRKSMGGRIAPGSPHIHDLERAHDELVRGGGFESEAHKADANGPVYLEWMEMVNVICCN